MPETAAAPQHITVNVIQLGESKPVELEGSGETPPTLGQLVDKAIQDAGAVDVQTAEGASAPDTPLKDGDTVTVAPKQVKHG